MTLFCNRFLEKGKRSGSAWVVHSFIVNYCLQSRKDAEMMVLRLRFEGFRESRACMAAEGEASMADRRRWMFRRRRCPGVSKTSTLAERRATAKGSREKQEGGRSTVV
jgi:hypothetical protein